MPKTSSESWQCPECGRRFVRRTREHSCQITSVEAHLAKTSPEVAAAFREVERVLRGFGPLTVVPVKTMITFRVNANFGGVTLTRARMDLGFFLPRIVRDARVQRVVPMSGVRFVHHVHLRSAAEVDGVVVGWLREAYAMAAG
jgi:hypothetical protein